MPSYSALKYLTLTRLTLLIKHYRTPAQSPTMNELLLLAKSTTDYWNADCDLKSDIEKLNNAAGLLKGSAGDTVVWHSVKQTCPQVK